MSRKLDLILEKVNGLEKRVTELESESDSVQQEVEQVAQTASKGLAIPNDSEGKGIVFQADEEDTLALELTFAF